MTAISRFEDLVAWQKARALTRDIYRLTRRDGFCRDFGLCNQIQRAAVSVMSNIAEGFERNRLSEFHQSLSTAKSSCGEVRSELYVAFDVGYIPEDVFRRHLAQAEEVGRIVNGLRASIEPSKNSRRR